MPAETVARRYALAIFSLAQEQRAVADVAKDLHVIRDAICEDAAAERFFLSPVIDRKEKERVLSAAFSPNAHEVALHALLLLVRKRREALLRQIVEQYDVLQMQARGAQPLTVTSAKPLSRDELDSVVKRLERMYRTKFEVTERTDPNLIGGLRIMMGDRLIDGTVEGRLQELSRTLFAQP